MNIFALDLNPKICAQYHCDKHVVKMILEHVQMMSTVTGKGYKPTHKNHPCTKWVSESLANYMWLMELTKELNAEWQYRFGHIRNHKSFDVMMSLPTPNLPDIGMTEFAQAMPEQYRSQDSIQAYRNYYKYEKSSLLKYTKRERPSEFI